MRNRIVATGNIRRVLVMADEVAARPPGLPGIMIITAPCGWGKTYSVLRLAQERNLIYVTAKRQWTPIWAFHDIAHELQIPERGRCALMFPPIVEQLRIKSDTDEVRPLVVDEADYLLKKPELLEGLRDIHDACGAPLILIGMEGFRQGLRHFPQIAGRVARWVELDDLSLDDALLVTAECCDVKVSKDLVTKLYYEAGGMIRPFTLGLFQIEALAKRRRLSEISTAEWGDYVFDFAEAPLPRRARSAPATAPMTATTSARRAA
jgi:DNA transposition AAA+ family ATPase